jgi:putative spermidine/putrescine transport system substrate-binding protein
MRRRLRVLSFLAAFAVLSVSCGGGTAAPAATGGTAASLKGTNLNFYSGGDTNVQDLHQKQVIPGFEAATGVKVTFTFLEHGTGEQGIYDRLKAQKETNKATWDIDLWEAGTARYTQPEDLFQEVTAKDIPNLAHVPKPTLDFVNNRAVPYRGSSVVLAYNSAKVTSPPKTYDDILAWAKANPGKFAYNEPSTGGSGDAFVISMLYKHSDYNKYLGKPFSAANEKDWDAAFAELKALAPSLYQKGVYPKGNAGTLDLLNRGEIWMAPVWSDQATQWLADGRQPDGKHRSSSPPGEPSPPRPIRAAVQSAPWAGRSRRCLRWCRRSRPRRPWEPRCDFRRRPWSARPGARPPIAARR